MTLKKREKQSINNHCLYDCYCSKDESKCCYLSNNRCLINEYEENYIFKEKR